MDKKSNELALPVSIDTAKRSMELIRVWLVDGQQEILLTPNLWKDPAAWGLLLVDVARHLSVHYESLGLSKEESLARIKAGFDSEWNNPTD